MQSDCTRSVGPGDEIVGTVALPLEKGGLQRGMPGMRAVLPTQSSIFSGIRRKN